jgi:hypothetical protein
MPHDDFSLQAEGRRTWDETLVLWLLHLADQGTLVPANHVAPLIEAPESEILGCGFFLQYCRDVLGWAPTTFPQLIASLCPEMSVRASMQFLAYVWVHLYAVSNQQPPPRDAA